MPSSPLPDKIYYSIAELSKHFGVANSLLRYWEKEFDKINPKRNAKGTRFYSKQDVEQIKLVYHLVKEKGHTLEGARNEIKTQKKQVKNRIQVKESLLEIKSQLENLRDYL
jgi:DNA-binding transcriptional MerR regulator